MNITAVFHCGLNVCRICHRHEDNMATQLWQEPCCNSNTAFVNTHTWATQPPRSTLAECAPPVTHATCNSKYRLAYKSLTGSGLKAISDMLVPYKPLRTLRTPGSSWVTHPSKENLQTCDNLSVDVRQALTLSKLSICQLSPVTTEKKHFFYTVSIHFNFNCESISVRSQCFPSFIVPWFQVHYITLKLYVSCIACLYFWTAKHIKLSWSMKCALCIKMPCLHWKPLSITGNSAISHQYVVKKLYIYCSYTIT